MAHQVNPAGFRLGKTFLWAKNEIFNSNNQLTVLKNTNLSQGVDNTINQVLQRNNLLVVKSSVTNNSNSNTILVNVLYYPLVSAPTRMRAFPTYSFPRALLNKPTNYNIPFKTVISKFWVSKTREFNNRFVRTKLRKNLNKMITKSMFKGSNSFVGRKNNLFKVYKLNSLNNVNNYIKTVKMQYQSLKNKTCRWRNSKKKINSYTLSKQLSKRIGIRINIKLQNVFSYLAKKYKNVTFKKHQRHIWNKRYHYNKKRFTSYYDIVNSMYLLSFISNTENLVLKMIQNGLTNMHRRKIRPKNMFYFLNSIVKNMKVIQKNFNAFRLIITGKLRGGTSRTQSFSTGYGVIPQQTLDKNIGYAFSDVRSKYGSFGVKILTWRKSNHETLTDSKVKWTLMQQRRTKKSKLLIFKNQILKKTLKRLRLKFKRSLI